METPQQKTVPTVDERLAQAGRDYAILLGTVESTLQELTHFQEATGVYVRLRSVHRLEKLVAEYRAKQVQELPFS